jgi:Ras-related protein Rab-21
VYAWDAGARVDSGALLVYDITDVDSFARVKNWVKELRKIVGDDISICIAGNKKDLQKNAHVSMEEADAYAASVGAQHIRTSAKLNQGVNEVFLALVQSAFSRFLRSSFSLCGV